MCTYLRALLNALCFYHWVRVVPQPEDMRGISDYFEESSLLGQPKLSDMDMAAAGDLSAQFSSVQSEKNDRRSRRCLLDVVCAIRTPMLCCTYCLYIER